MGDKEELLTVIDERFQRIEDKLDKFLGRFMTSVAVGVTLFLFIIGGAFSYIKAVDNKAEKNAVEIESQGADLTDIDGALEHRFPDSAVFGERHRREVSKRGGQ